MGSWNAWVIALDAPDPFQVKRFCFMEEQRFIAALKVIPKPMGRPSRRYSERRVMVEASCLDMLFQARHVRLIQF
ncbi:hypothetical protein C5H23_09145 [Xylella fastidiosa]|nr:hypothetical protein P303_04305 [Xylella fastidiosa MUL0034]EWG14252.1 hypothetical protein P910_002457 [Xylella fastidiosa Mul-MD]TNV88832.1 hypothetical protein C5H23_09145 [Xylella fastidiosa]TNV96185.1 hypothetical protein C5H22_06655 [Xylella fastidiosa]TNV99562.1 hypothetical protein C5H21_03350 [Xylella fastidiosa]